MSAQCKRFCIRGSIRVVCMVAYKQDGYSFCDFIITIVLLYLEIKCGVVVCVVSVVAFADFVVLL
jgi:hypothetical protein